MPDIGCGPLAGGFGDPCDIRFAGEMPSKVNVRILLLGKYQEFLGREVGGIRILTKPTTFFM